MSRRGKPPVVCEPGLGASRSIAAGRDGHTVFGVPIEWTNAHCAPVCSANFFTEMFGWSDNVLFGQCAGNNDSVAPSQGVMFFACVENPHGAHFWFRRLKFTHATVLTLTNGNCCRKFRVGACSHSVRKVYVCRSITCEVRLPRERHIFSEFCFTHDDVWYSQCYVLVLRIALFVQGVCVF